SDDEISWAQRDASRHQPYQRVASLHEEFGIAEEGDFSQRLVRQVDRVVSAFSDASPDSFEQVTEDLYRGDLRDLTDAVADFLALKEEVWVLVDNLDKGWPTRGASSVDILIV